MKRLILALVAAGAVLAAPARADVDFGVKVGQLSVEDDDGAATQAGIVMSWDLLGMLGVEGELNTTLADGDIGGFDYSATQVGAYGVLMTPGPFYFKAKAGMLVTNGEVAGEDVSDTQPAYGVGIGFTFFELEWTRTKVEDDIAGIPFESDVDVISLSFKF
jgi:hypothetical protein